MVQFTELKLYHQSPNIAKEGRKALLPAGKKVLAVDLNYSSLRVRTSNHHISQYLLTSDYIFFI